MLRRTFTGIVAMCLMTLAVSGNSPVSANPGSPPTPAAAAQAAPAQFQQPLIQGEAADPSIIFHNGNYYMIYNKTGYQHAIVGRKASSLAGLRFAPDQVIYTAHGEHPTDTRLGIGYAAWLTPYNGRWYLYGWGDDGLHTHSKPFVLESAGADPFGPFTYEAAVPATPISAYGYANAPVTINGQRYITQTSENRIYIASLSNPWTLSSPWSLLAQPATTGWECANNRCLDEGGSVVERNGKVFYIFSAGGYESVDYCVGMLTADVTANPLLQSSWTKSNDCVFEQSGPSFGPGSMTFFKSPDGTEDWVVYHIKTTQQLTGNARMLQAKRIDWAANGTPIFGQPAANDTYAQVPSGDPGGYPGIMTFEAEAGTVTGAPVTPSGYASGNAYVASVSPGRSVGLSIGALGSMSHRLYLHYSNPGAAATLVVKANGANPVTVRVPSTGAGSGGRFPIDRYVAVDLQLEPGYNPVTIEGSSGAVDLDKVHVDHRVPASGLAIASRGQSYLDFYTVKPNGQVWSRATANGTDWGSWFQPGAALATGARPQPGAVSRKASWLDLFVIGRNGTVYQKWWHGEDIGGTGWQSWVSIGSPGPGVQGSGVAVAGRTANNLDVFVLGADNNVWTRAWQDPSAGGAGWSAWSNIGAPVVGAVNGPAVAAIDGSHLDVFVTGSDGFVWVRTWNGSVWSNWTPLGSPPGGATSAPTVATQNAFDLDLFVRGADGTVWTRQWSLIYFGWGPWNQLPVPPGATNAAPGAVSRRATDTPLDVVARTSDNQIRWTWWDKIGETWQPWSSLGTPP